MKILGSVKCGVSLLNKLPSWGLNGHVFLPHNNLSQKTKKIFCKIVDYPGDTNKSSLPLALFKENQHYLRRSIIKVGVLTGAVTTAGYATYAYTLEEVDNKAKGLRECTTHVAENVAPTLKKFQASLYSAAMTVSAKSIEMYLDFRRSVEKQVQAARGWRTFERPGADAFLEHLAQFFEIVVYSDMPNTSVGPVIQRLDMNGCIRYSLSRHATKYQNGVYYRDLSKLNRDPSRIIYVSGHALEFCLQPENCIQIKAWKSEADDRELSDLVPFLEFAGLHRPHDIREILLSYKGRDIASEFNQHPEEFQRWKHNGKPADSRPAQ